MRFLALVGERHRPATRDRRQQRTLGQHCAQRCRSATTDGTNTVHQVKLVQTLSAIAAAAVLFTGTAASAQPQTTSTNLTRAADSNYIPPTSEVGAISTRPESRLFDSREEDNKLSTTKPGKFSAFETKVLTLPVGESEKYILNLTVVGAEGDGFMTIWSGDGERPNTSSVNYTKGQTIANQVHLDATTAPGQPLKISIYSHAAAHVVLDLVSSYSATMDGFTSIAPTRMHDSRSAQSTASQNRVTTVQALPDNISPENVEAVVANVTIVGKGQPGFATVWPEGERPLASSLNYLGDSLISNQAITKVSRDGTFKVYTHSEAEVIVDVVGYIKKDQGIVMHQPVRLLDEREAKPEDCCHAVKDDLVRLQVEQREEAPEWNKGHAIVNVTVVGSTRPGFVSARALTSTGFMAASLPAETSTQNYKAGAVRAAMAIVPVSKLGTIEFFRMGDARIVVDLVGYTKNVEPTSSASFGDPNVLHKKHPHTLAVGPDGALFAKIPTGLKVQQVVGLPDSSWTITDGHLKVPGKQLEDLSTLKIRAVAIDGQNAPRTPKAASYEYTLNFEPANELDTDSVVDLSKGQYLQYFRFASSLQPGSQQQASWPYALQPGSEIRPSSDSEYANFSSSHFKFQLSPDRKSANLTIPSRKTHREVLTVGGGEPTVLKFTSTSVHGDTVNLTFLGGTEGAIG